MRTEFEKDEKSKAIYSSCIFVIALFYVNPHEFEPATSKSVIYHMMTKIILYFWCNNCNKHENRIKKKKKRKK